MPKPKRRPVQDKSVIGRARDITAVTIANGVVRLIATPWYQRMSTGIMRTGMIAGAVNGETVPDIGNALQRELLVKYQVAKNAHTYPLRSEEGKVSLVDNEEGVLAGLLKVQSDAYAAGVAAGALLAGR
ncbi:hypothetical protein [Leifsonia sp. Leaf264]|uniref:hypothetical protein n=1 Tax=Leifsonia sp. Leaf264 TaxID=1736314 RepID=UPI0006F36FAD|nr:hypothetical protein [Leifsonia sp. Leaf264]KQO98398.1 hypothetical protein ASF30_10075 [Leifsonia sp. Leaf264]